MVAAAATIAVLWAGGAGAQDAAEALQPGEAYVTRFSGTVPEGGSAAINTEGVVGSIIDIRNPGQAPQGQHWLNEPQRIPVTAGEVGQVFGVAFDDADAPNIYLTATSAFGLHRTADSSDWMSGMWGPGAGPGTVWKLDAANGYKPVVFSQITLDDRENTGAALGAIAYDPWHKQFYVSDLETGMIHRLNLDDGTDLGHFDHGVDGRASFVDAATGQQKSLPPVAFDPDSSAHVADCAEGALTATPSCWNFADFRRRVWGLGVRRDSESEEVRLYYAVWSSQGFGNAEFAAAGEDEKRNSVWSIAISTEGDFDTSTVRKEYDLPDFSLDPKALERAGHSNPVSDIEFPQCSDDQVMLVAERGGVRNLGLSADNPFAFPHEARVLRYQADANGIWQPTGRYDVGFYDRKADGTPFLRSNGAGGVAFGYGYKTDWSIDLDKPNDWAWMTGDFLCTGTAPCFNPDTGKREDGSEVDGAQGTPADAYVEVDPAQASQPYPATGEATLPTGPLQSWMIDTDQNVGADGQVIMSELTRNDATKIGDIEIYEPCEGQAAGQPPLEQPPVVELPPDAVPPPVVEYPPVADGPDLEKAKEGPGECIEGDICTFTITVTNVGPGDWSGPLTEVDTLPPGAVLFDYTPQPEWLCSQVVGVDEVDCYHDWIDLAPGESVQLTIDLLLPFGVTGPVENCIEDTFLASRDPNDPAVILAIERQLNAWGYLVGPIDGVLDAVTINAISELQIDNGLPVTGFPDDALIDLLFPAASIDANPANDFACAMVDVLPAPLPPPPLVADLQARKIQQTAECLPGGLCTFELWFLNRGPGEWVGRPRLTDTLPPGAALEGSSAPWVCDQAGQTVSCRHPFELTMAPGDIRIVTIDVRMPPGLVPGAENCVAIDWPGDVRDPNIGNDRECIPVRVGTPPVPDLETVKKIAGGDCTAGKDCQFDIWFTNRGPGNWTGKPGLVDLLPAGATFKSATAPWVCTPAGGLVNCEHPDVTLPPFQSLKLTLTVTLPATVPAGSENCSRINRPPGVTDPVPQNDRSCVGIPASGPQPPPPPVRTGACNDTIRDGGDAPESITIDLGGYQGTAKFSWDHFSVKDRMKLFAGGQLLHDTQCVGGSGTKDFPTAGIPNVTVVVEPNCDGTTGTAWNFKVECPAPTTPPPPPSAPPDQEAKKSQVGSCQAGGKCDFLLEFVNNGPGDWTGKPTLVDKLPAGASFVSATAPWVCTPAGNEVSCEHPDVTLPAGQGVRATVTITLPTTLSPGSENCAQIQRPPLTTDAVPLNDKACVPVTAAPAPAPPPRTAACNDTVRNGGDTPETVTIDLGGFQGTAKFSWDNFSVKDRMKLFAGGQLIHDTQCVGGSGTKDFPAAGLPNVTVVVEPNCDGTSSTAWNFKVECQLPNIVQPPPPPPPPPPPTDQVVRKTQLGACEAGGSCDFLLEFINNGPANWSGRPVLTDMLPDPNIALGSWSPSEWVCTAAQGGVRCEHPDVAIPPGGSVSITLTLNLPHDLADGLQNCLQIGDAETHSGDADPSNDQACIPITVTTHTPVFKPKPPSLHPPLATPPAIAPPSATCPAGTHLEHGVCVRPPAGCPSGTYLDHGVCIKPTQSCPGGTYFSHGVCVRTCPPGTHLDGGICVLLTSRCPLGTYFDHGACVRPPLRCLSGTHLEYGMCVPSQKACPSGSHLEEGHHCVPNQPSCPGGYHLDGGHCVPKAASCPAGSHFAGGHCTPNKSTCGAGSHLTGGGHCAPNKPSCPAGTHPAGGHCAPNKLSCPAGTHPAGGHCAPNKQACPAGAHRVGNHCVSNKPAVVPHPGGGKQKQQACPAGAHRVGGHCVSNRPAVAPHPGGGGGGGGGGGNHKGGCPKGYHPKNGVCVPKNH